MGLCHSHGFGRRSSSVKPRTKAGSVTSLDKDSNSNSTQINEKRGKTPNINIKRIKDKENLSEMEYEINRKNENNKFDIISQIDKMSNYSEKIKYDIIKEETNDKKKSKMNESFFNKGKKQNNKINENKNINVKQKQMINIRTKFNNFSKKEFETPIKLKNIDNNNFSTIKTDKEKKEFKEIINQKNKKTENVKENKNAKAEKILQELLNLNKDFNKENKDKIFEKCIK